MTVHSGNMKRKASATTYTASPTARGHQNNHGLTSLNGPSSAFLPPLGQKMLQHYPLSAPHATQESLMFLKPTQMAKDEACVLRIIDVFDKVVPNTEERMISEVGLTKFLASCGPMKAKVDPASLAQWVIGNIKFFIMLMRQGKLPSWDDVQLYLAYNVKIMELSPRFTFASVLR